MELTQRFTMYDLFSMVFPGCFILWDIFDIFKIGQYINEISYFKDYDLLYYFAFFITAYLVGIVWNTIIGDMWRKFIKTISEGCIRNELKDKKEEFFNYWDELKGDSNTERYKFAYGVVRKDNTTSSINSFESQISMLRNMAIPFAVWIGTIVHNANIDVCFCVIIVIILSLALFGLALIRNKRLYHVVLANFLRIKRSESDNTKSSNTISLSPQKEEVILKIQIPK